MGNKYTITAWAKHDGINYSDATIYGGQRLLPALWAFWKASGRGFGCLALEVRR